MEEEPKSHKSATILLVIAAIVLLIIALFIGYTLLQKQQEPTPTPTTKACIIGSDTACINKNVGDKCTGTDKKEGLCKISTGTNTCGCVTSQSTCTTADAECAGKSTGADLGCVGQNKPLRCTCKLSPATDQCASVLIVDCTQQDNSCAGTTSTTTSTGTTSTQTGKDSYTSSTTTQSTTSSATTSTAAPTTLPDTGLFDDLNSNIVLAGFLLILAGWIALRFNLLDNLLGTTPRSYEEQVTEDLEKKE